MLLRVRDEGRWEGGCLESWPDCGRSFRSAERPRLGGHGRTAENSAVGPASCGVPCRRQRPAATTCWRRAASARRSRRTPEPGASPRSPSGWRTERRSWRGTSRPSSTTSSPRSPRRRKAFTGWNAGSATRGVDALRCHTRTRSLSPRSRRGLSRAAPPLDRPLDPSRPEAASLPCHAGSHGERAADMASQMFPARQRTIVDQGASTGAPRGIQHSRTEPSLGRLSMRHQPPASSARSVTVASPR
jgi:hypothetical protein